MRWHMPTHADMRWHVLKHADMRCCVQAIETLKSFEKKDNKVAATAATNLSFLYMLVRVTSPLIHHWYPRLITINTIQ